MASESDITIKARCVLVGLGSAAVETVRFFASGSTVAYRDMFNYLESLGISDRDGNLTDLGREVYRLATEGATTP